MYDILVIGGGINGAGIARDAAGRGLKTLLVERDDLAQHTSSASTKLIHGGLRYLEYYDFKLVRKALIEREVLLKAAPHIIWPMRFVLPHQKGLRPAWLVRLGLFLYDHIGGRKMLPPTKVLRRGHSRVFDSLKDHLRLAFEYSDCWVEDARLVALNAIDAMERGGDVLTRHECIQLERETKYWRATLRQPDGTTKTIEARTVVNAAGPWVDDVLGLSAPGTNRPAVRLVKGSHIIVKRKFEGDHAYFFQNGDGRIMFAIPYEAGRFTLIGTTDLTFNGNRRDVEISDEEITYMCDGASEYFKAPVTQSDIVSTYSGVRPLYEDHADDASAVSRDYVLSYDRDKGAPLLSVFGGKITTYRELSERALNLMLPDLPGANGNWTKKAILPGGDMPKANADLFLTHMREDYPWMPQADLKRLVRAYGTRLNSFLKGTRSVGDLGHHFGGGLYEAEVKYLMKAEFAQTSEDILWRRSKLGLHLSEADQAGLHTWIAENANPLTAASARMTGS